MQVFRALSLTLSFARSQGLAAHLTDLHSPAGSWLCAVCGMDCASQTVKATHEKACAGEAAKRRDAAFEEEAAAAAVVAADEDGFDRGEFDEGLSVEEQIQAAKALQAEYIETLFEEYSFKPKSFFAGCLRIPTFRGVFVNSDGK